MVVHVQRPENTPLNSHRRLVWCPFIQDDSEENQDDASQTLALLHEDRVIPHPSKRTFYILFLFYVKDDKTFLTLVQAEVWDLEVLRANHSSWPVDATDLKEGLITVKGHTKVGGQTGLCLFSWIPLVCDLLCVCPPARQCRSLVS